MTWLELKMHFKMEFYYMLITITVMNNVLTTSIIKPQKNWQNWSFSASKITLQLYNIIQTVLPDLFWHLYTF